jgi:ribonuclease P protein component
VSTVTSAGDREPAASGVQREAAAPGAPLRLDRSRRIRKRADFTRIQDGGIRASAGPLLLLGELRDDDAPARLGIVASRKVGNAVARNRAKRLIREAFRRHAARMPPGLDLVVIARPGLEQLDLATVASELGAALPRLVRRLRPPAAGTKLRV